MLRVPPTGACSEILPLTIKLKEEKFIDTQIPRMECLFCFRSHEPDIKCKERLQAMALYIQSLEVVKKPLKQTSITKFLIKPGQKSVKTLQEPLETIVISSDEDQPQRVSKRRRKSLNRCSNCQDLLHDCSCESFKDQNHQVVEMTLKDPKIKSFNQKLIEMADFLRDKMGAAEIEEILVSDWLNWLIEWAEKRGRCVYASGEKGLSPASAKVFFNIFQKVIKQNFEFDFLQKFPEARKFANQWQKYICREKLYRRTQANYFSKDDVKDYNLMFDHVINNGSPAQEYYARMAKVILTVSIIFAGCRVGALLDIRLGSVSFFSIGETIIKSFHEQIRDLDALRKTGWSTCKSYS